jgi:hypothetical protein
MILTTIGIILGISAIVYIIYDSANFPKIEAIELVALHPDLFYSQRFIVRVKVSRLQIIKYYLYCDDDYWTSKGHLTSEFDRAAKMDGEKARSQFNRMKIEHIDKRELIKLLDIVETTAKPKKAILPEPEINPLILEIVRLEVEGKKEEALLLQEKLLAS